MNKIRELRNQKGLSLRALAEISGMSFSNLGSIERGEVQLREDTAKIFANIFNVSIDYLLGNETDNQYKNFENAIPESQLQFALHGYENDLTDDDKEMIINLAKTLALKNKK